MFLSKKPLTLKTEEARWLAEYADKTDRILMVGHLLLYQPAITWMRDYLASGKAGTVRHIATQRLKLGRVRAEENVWWSFAPPRCLSGPGTARTTYPGGG